MKHWTRFSIVIAAGLLVSGCDWGPFGPSKSVAGNWGATGCCMESQRYELSLTEQGDLIKGVVCSTLSGTLGAKAWLSAAATRTFDSTLPGRSSSAANQGSL
jgi:hypothetical protein